MKEIPLTQGKVAIVDDCDYDYLSQWKWCISNGYAARRKSKHSGHLETMHSLIFKRQGFQGEMVDHIDRNTLNNRRSNLRPATMTQNQYNCPAQKNNTSGFKGVWLDKRANKWRAQIRAGGKSIYLGTGVTKEDAARIWNEGALKLHGEFAYQNVIPEQPIG